MRLALWAAVLAVAVAAAPGGAHADPIHYAFHQLVGDDDGGGGAPLPPPSTLADVVGPATSVTLPDLLVLAVRQAPALELARIDIAVAEARIEEARGIEDWTVGADLTAGTSVSTFFVAGMKLTTTRTQAQLGGDVARMLPWGGTVSFHAETAWGLSTDDAGSVNEFTDNISATWVQPLMRGRGRKLVYSGQAAAAIYRDATEIARSALAIAVVRDTVIAYWDLVLARRDLEIRQGSLALAGERLRLTQAANKGGKVALTEVLAVEQVIATREEEVLAAELTVLDRSITLRRLVGMEIGVGQLALTTETDLGVPSRAWDLEVLLDDAYRSSPELALLAKQADIAEINVEFTENGMLPALDLAITFGPTGRDDDPGHAFINMVTVDEVTALASLSYQQSVGNRAASGRTREVRAERQRVRINDADTRAQIAQALAASVVLATTAERRVALAGKAIALAEQNIVAEQSRFGLGKSTNFDVLTRQDELKQAQLRQARAIVEWHKAATLISAISGELLQRYGIALDD